MAMTEIKGKAKGKNIPKTRFKAILSYIVWCHEKMLKDGKTYHKKDKGTYLMEDYLTEGLVMDYLAKNKAHLKISGNLYITFNTEPTSKYINKNGEPSPNKIDIKITDTALVKTYNQPSETLFYTIECKRLFNEKNRNVAEYIGDIQKYLDRADSFPFPIVGLLGYVEDKKAGAVNHTIALAQNIQTRNSFKTPTNWTLVITNTNDLQIPVSNISTNFSTDYQRNTDNKKTGIYHVLLDYSEIVKP
jgi:hypothetical protein